MKEYSLMIDPPGGWRYGFPTDIATREFESVPVFKDFPREDWNERAYTDLLLAKGYPASQVDLAMKYSRFWIEEVKDVY